MWWVSVLLSSGQGSLVCFSGGLRRCCLCQLGVMLASMCPAALEPQREPLQALLRGEVTDCLENGRGRRERMRGHGPGPGRGSGWCLCWGVTWLHPSVALVGGTQL